MNEPTTESTQAGGAAPGADRLTADPPSPAPLLTPAGDPPTQAPPSPSADAPAAAVQPAPPALSREACARELAARFPALFAATDGAVLPIKLRIHLDIHARAPGVFSRAVLGAFFARHTTTTPYLKSLVAAATRFDLDGAPAGDIADVHRQAAIDELARRRDIVKARQRMQRQALGPTAPTAEGAASTTKGAAPSPDADPQGRQAVPLVRDARPPRGPRGATGSQDGPARRGEHTAQPPRQPNRPHPTAGGPTPPVVVADAQQRERAALLRAFQSSPLSKANFCALKRMSPETLDAQLALALSEQAARS
jgi:ProP effector